MLPTHTEAAAGAGTAVAVAALALAGDETTALAFFLATEQRFLSLSQKQPRAQGQPSLWLRALRLAAGMPRFTSPRALANGATPKGQKRAAGELPGT